MSGTGRTVERYGGFEPQMRPIALGGADQVMRIDRVSSAGAALDPAARLKLLTSQERDVLSGIVTGLTNKAIAASYGMSIEEVERCRLHLMETLQVEDLRALVSLALAGGMNISRR